MKKNLFFLALILTASQVYAGNKIKCYFNQPVDTTVATTQKAVYLKNCITDTLVAYLNRARYSLDIEIYDFEKTITYASSTYTPPLDTVDVPMIATAINNAYARGVKVRVIADGGNANTGLTLLDSHINVLRSPTGGSYNIMHNKFAIIDAASPDASEPTVWTGCMNWYYQQLNWDFNNVIIFQDSALAFAYTAEFNMMWGDTGIVPNHSTSKFGPYKTDLGLHNFMIDGTPVQLYFSPSDHTDTYIQSTIKTAHTDLYFGVYDYTEVTDATDIISKYDSGVYVSGIVDNTSGSYMPSILTTLGTHLKIYVETDTSLYHNKFVIVDPSDTCSDPTVLTGSHNWTTTANTKNDENTVIVHNNSIANQYYQYFKGSFNSLGGVMTPQTGCTISESVSQVASIARNCSIYPNPSNGEVTISYQLANAENVTVELYNLLGQKIATLANGATQQAGRHSFGYAFAAPGVYLVHIVTGNVQINRQVVIAN